MKAVEEYLQGVGAISIDSRVISDKIPTRRNDKLYSGQFEPVELGPLIDIISAQDERAPAFKLYVNSKYTHPNTPQDQGRLEVYGDYFYVKLDDACSKIKDVKKEGTGLMTIAKTGKGARPKERLEDHLIFRTTKEYMRQIAQLANRGK